LSNIAIKPDTKKRIDEIKLLPLDTTSALMAHNMIITPAILGL